MRRHFFNHIAQTSPSPPALEIVSGNGSFLYDSNGKEYIDCISGIAVSSLGHQNERIRNAVIQQIEKHSHVMVFGEYIQNPQVELARKLTSLLPEQLSSVYFTNSGAEAIEGSMKLAKRYMGRTKFVACKNAYHGSTQGALSLMGNETYKQSFRPLLPDVSFIRYNKIEDLNIIDELTAAVFIEPVQSETGYIPGEATYFHELHEQCKKTGALLVFDEAQSGFGRTGRMFGFEHFGLTPDVLVLAKALGGGYPLGAFIASKELTSVLSHDPPLGHLTTFGGHPMSCAASLAFIEQLLQPGFIELITQKEHLFKTLLSESLYSENITGLGLMLGLHLHDQSKCQKVIGIAEQNGLLADWFLFAPDAIRLAPPLNISEELIKRSCSIINSAIHKAK